jgi:extradiol dioxygenase family protein
MSCNHTRETSRWVTVDYFGEEIDGEWEYTTETTTVDIDLHRYKCTQCGEIMYYSGRARDYYEKGIKSDWITGLDK